MQIPQFPTGMISQSNGLQQIGIAMLGKQLDTVEATGDMLAASLSSMPAPSLETMVHPHMGGNIDLSI